VPLSEEELRLLEQMERALVAEDPKFASTLRGTRIRQHARRQVIVGVLAFVIGVALLMAGAVIPEIALGVVGFVVMLGSAYFTLTSWRGQSAALASGAGGDTGDRGDQGLRVIQGGKTRGKSKKAKPQGSMMDRFEERWRRRKEQNGGL
jgi:hypothetical protein